MVLMTGALGVVFTIIGIFMIVAAVQFNPQKAKGLDTALSELLHLPPFGPVLLGIVALGLIAYGVYSFVEARYAASVGRNLQPNVWQRNRRSVRSSEWADEHPPNRQASDGYGDRYQLHRGRQERRALAQHGHPGPIATTRRNACARTTGIRPDGHKRCHYLSQHISATGSDTNTKQWNR